MNLRTLKYLIAVVDYQHFGKAAEACFVSQPTLSMQLKKLEEDLGIQLIERKNKKILITPLAKQVAERGKRILSEVAQLKKMANYFTDPYSSEINVGILPTIAPYLLPIAMPVLHQRFPKLQLHLQEDNTQRLKKGLVNGELDAIIIAESTQKEEDLEALSLYEEPFHLVLPLKHRLASKPKIRIEDLNNEALLLLTEEHCLRHQIWHFCQSNDFKIADHYKATSLETIRQLVAAGYGITLMPKFACTVKDERIKYCEFISPVPKREVNLIWRQSAIQKNLFEQLASAIKESVKA